MAERDGPSSTFPSVVPSLSRRGVHAHPTKDGGSVVGKVGSLKFTNNTHTHIHNTRRLRSFCGGIFLLHGGYAGIRSGGEEREDIKNFYMIIVIVLRRVVISRITKNTAKFIPTEHFREEKWLYIIITL